MPTPARLATASRLASEPPALNTALAASSTRSRLRNPSARGLRRIAADGPAIEEISENIFDHDLVRPDQIATSSHCLSTIFSEIQSPFCRDRSHLAKRRVPP